MKTCFKCSRRLPLTEFYRHSQMGDGHLNKCKECTKRDAKQQYWRKVKDQNWLESERARGREKHRRLGYSRRYRGKSRKYQAAWQERYPEKRRAQTAVKNAVRDGRLIKPNACQECGSGGPIQGHHPDYSKPLEVMWLCVPCHGRQHRKEAA